MNREREYAKLLLQMETAIGIVSLLAFLALFYTAVLLIESTLWQTVLIIAAFVILLLGVVFALRAERLAGYYVCEKCGHRYIPNALPFFFSMHVGRTRYLRCPRCDEKSWQKKDIDAE